MTERAMAVAEAFQQLSEYERVLAYVEIEKVWRAPYEGPEPWIGDDDEKPGYEKGRPGFPERPNDTGGGSPDADD